ncbi:MAG: geranylgeranyl reductase family protein [Planctomycetes bacterium]|nr:geranylgeranyl reductase family protein [Planctomycetota bacterium]
MGSASSPVRDVVIVGGSVAGCRAALALAQAGREVLVLDKARFPRWKPCAGGITRKAAPFLPPELQACFERPVRGVRLSFGHEHSTRVTTGEILGWTVHRETFDAAHLELVRSTPRAEVVEGVTVREVHENEDHAVVATERESFRARVVIGADGANSVVSRALPGHGARRFGFAYEEEAELAPPSLEEEALFDFKGIPSGYGWVFPKRGYGSVGAYVYRGKLRAARRVHEEFCEQVPETRGRSTLRARGHLVPHGGSQRRLNTGRLLLAGDAGDLVDPLSGEGIYYALRSGQLAAEAAGRFLAGDAPLDAYGDLIRGEIQDDLASARRIADLVFHFPRAAFLVLFKNEWVCRGLLEVLLGQRNYRSLWSALCRQAWRLPFGTRRARHGDFRLDLAE